MIKKKVATAMMAVMMVAGSTVPTFAASNSTTIQTGPLKGTSFGTLKIFSKLASGTVGK